MKFYEKILNRASNFSILNSFRNSIRSLGNVGKRAFMPRNCNNFESARVNLGSGADYLDYLQTEKKFPTQRA